MKVHKIILSVTTLTMAVVLKPATALDYYRYFFGNYNTYHNNHKQAEQWYKKLLHEQAPFYVYKGYVEFLFKTGKMQEIVQLLPQLDTQFINDPDLQLISAQALAHTGDVKGSEERLIRASSQHKKHQEIVFHTAQIYIRRKEPESALALIDSFLNSTPRTPTHYVFYFLKSQIYTSLNNLKEAITNIKQSIEINPSFEKGKVLLALLQEKSGQPQKALQTYNTLLAQAQSPLLKRQIRNHLLASNSSGKSSPQAPPLTTRQLEQHEVQKQFSNALATVDNQLKQHPKDTNVRTRKLKLLAAQKEYGTIAHLLKSWIQEEPTRSLWYELLYQLAQKHDINKIIAVLVNQEKQDPNNPLVLTYLGALYNKAHELQKSLDYFDKAYTKTTDKQLKTKILFQQALIYHDRKEYQPMFAKLEAGEHLGLNYPPLLNMLAYSYAKQNRQLDKAQKLIKQVLKADNSNPYYLDTQALILYAQHDYNKARTILQKLVKEHPKDTTILSHLSRVLVQLGQKGQAKDLLQNALKIAKNAQERSKFQGRLQELQ